MRTVLNLLSLSLSLLALAASPLSAQTAAAAPGAPLAASALGALDPGGVPVTSVRLSGTADWTAGSTVDAGTLTLEASGTGSSRVDIELSTGSRITVRAPAGASAGTGQNATSPGGTTEVAGTTSRLPLGDSFWPAAWFFPALALPAAAGPSAVLSDLGSQTLDESAPGGTALRHLRFALSPPNPDAAGATTVAALTQADWLLDPSTFLPAVLRFSRHPKGIVNRGYQVEVRYSDWRVVSGVEVPFHIERWVTGSRELVVTVQSVEINPPLASSQFQFGGAQ